jgi:EthD domain
MVRAFVLYEGDVDPERYQQHLDEFVSQIPATFRHGKIVATPVGEARFHHYAEFEFPDMESFQQVANSPEFAATGKDAATMGIPFSAQVVVIDE